MKRHYTHTPTGFKCVSCRQEFSTKREYAQHCKRGGKCKHPVSLRFTIDLGVSPYHWKRAA